MFLVLLGHGGDDLGDSGQCSSVPLPQLLLGLSLVLLGDDDGADVEDLSVFSSLVTCNHLLCIFLGSLETLGEPVDSDVGVLVDC
jgi:hypothetical protein